MNNDNTDRYYNTNNSDTSNAESDLCLCTNCEGACDRKALKAFDWMSDLPTSVQQNRWVEVQFKNTRKGIYENPLRLPLKRDDIVAVEGTPGMDIGCVTLTGELAQLRYNQQLARRNTHSIPQIFRLATPSDIERFEEVRALEHDTMIKARRIAADLNLDMKIGDVEYQGDGTKAIFYYIADNRVDFRTLIKLLGEAFHIRVEMRQIGARQEAGRIGGIGPCGRALCCASWMHDFCSVNAQSVRLQELNNNPEKITGQCGKLKCCINYEVDSYEEAHRKAPPRDILLRTDGGSYKLVKVNLLAGEATYRNTNGPSNEEITIPMERALQIIQMNQNDTPVASLDDNEASPRPIVRSKDVLEENSLTRFDKAISQKRRRKNRNRSRTKRTTSDEKA